MRKKRNKEQFIANAVSILKDKYDNVSLLLVNAFNSREISNKDWEYWHELAEEFYRNGKPLSSKNLENHLKKVGAWDKFKDDLFKYPNPELTEVL